jgi:hypothetical protein
MAAHTVDEVLAQLDDIVEWARRERSRAGYFAALYRNVTARVKDGILAGRFEDGERMARLDVVFANRYLDAFAARRTGRSTSRSWAIAFDQATRWPPLVLQHLLCGMNAHISLDLGVAAAEVCPGSALAALERDFGEINLLLGEMVDEVQQRIATISPWMWVLDRVGQRTDEVLCGFCMERARDLAWTAARQLAPLGAADRAREIERLDAMAAALAGPIVNPGRLVSSALMGVRVREADDVADVIDALDGRRPVARTGASLPVPPIPC